MKTEKEILKLAEIFDDIIGSDSRAVQEAFQRLVMLATMGKPDNDNFEQGPFARMITGIQVMEAEIKNLRRSVQILENKNLSGLDGIVSIDLSGTDVNFSTYSSSMPHVAPLTTIDISALTGLDMSAMNAVQTVTLVDNSGSNSNMVAFSGLDEISINSYNNWKSDK